MKFEMYKNGWKNVVCGGFQYIEWEEKAGFIKIYVW